MSIEPPPGVELDPACELFRRGDPSYRSMSTLGRWWLPCGAAFLGFMAPVIHNLSSRRPATAGIQRHILFALTGAVLGEMMQNQKTRGQAERDLQYYHYMTLHPEDFRPPKRILYRDYLEPWHPIR